MPLLPARPSLRGPAALALLAGLVAALVLIPGHRDHGLWSEGELGALQRAQADLGAALSGLERSPWLPDLLRTKALALTGDPAAIRLPGAIATSLLVALAALLARVLGFPARIALLAGGFALAFPLSLTQGRLALGNPTGELLSTLTAVLFAAALADRRLGRGFAFGCAALLALPLSLASSGLWLGVVLPLVAACLFSPAPEHLPPNTRPDGPVSADTADASLGSALPDLPSDRDLSIIRARPDPSDLSPAPDLPSDRDLSIIRARPDPSDLSPAPARASGAPDLPPDRDLSSVRARHAPSDLSPEPARASGAPDLPPDRDLSSVRARHAPSDLSPAPRRPPSARPDSPLRRPLLVLLALGALAAAGVAAWLAWRQGDGYIPVLAAARDLTLRERPHVRGFHGTLEDCGYQLFPWLPLVLLGLLQPGRARWPALWLASGLALLSAWTLLYDVRPVPLTVPAAVLAAAAFARLTAPRTPALARRLALVFALAGCWVFAKDARRTPSRVGAALLQRRGEHVYPAQALGAPDLLAGLASGAAVALVLSFLLVPTGTSGHARSRLSLALNRGRERLPPWLPVALVLAALARQTWHFSRELLPRTSEQLSLLRPLARYDAWAGAGELPRPLGVHRVSDPGIDLYGPPAEDRAPLATREALTTLLRKPAPAAALIRVSELAPLYQASRAAGFPVYVLDASNRDVLLVANVLPPGADDHNPIRRVLFDAPPALAHETLLRFDEFVEVIAWEWDEPVVRGREVELRVVLRALKPVPSGAKITVRLQQGRLSRINPLPHDLVENLYPSQYWRAGDYLLHRFRVQVPTLEVIPGPHEVVIGLRRSERNNYKITVPEASDETRGIKIFGDAREFAAVGEVQVW